MSAFNIVIEHRPGSKNPADGLLRRPDYREEVKSSGGCDPRTSVPTNQKILLELQRQLGLQPTASDEPMRVGVEQPDEAEACRWRLT